jgi:hypothetical protein
MSMQPSAVTVPAADSDLAGLGIAPVPEVWPPATSVTAVLDRPAAAGRPGPGRAGPDRGTAPSRGGHGQPPGRQPPGPRQFALLLAETLAGAMPAHEVLPLLSDRARAQLHRLLPLLRGEHRPRVLRVLTATPSTDAIEMTVVMLAGARARALAIRLEQAPATGRWLCTDIEAG